MVGSGGLLFCYFVLFFVRITVLPKKEIFHGKTTILISFFKENYRKLKKKIKFKANKQKEPPSSTKKLFNQKKKLRQKQKN